MYILGIISHFHNSSAALIKDGEIIAACEEERFNREKHSCNFPYHAINYCLTAADIDIDEVKHIGFAWNPLLEMKFGIKHFLKYFPGTINLLREFAADVPLFERYRFFLRLKDIIMKESFHRTKPYKLHFIEHHLAHSASAFYASHFKEAAILSIDCNGEDASTVSCIGRENKLNKIRQINFPHSLGAVYSAITDFLGFRPINEEGKVMGLSAYGKLTYIKEFQDIVRLKPDGGFEIDLSYFSYHLYGRTRWVSNRFVDKFGPSRQRGEELTQRHKDIAASLQKVVEETVLHLLSYLYKEAGVENLCIAGGVGLNSLMNNRVVENSEFKNVFFQPAANDAGTSLGAAYYVYYHILNGNNRYPMKDVYLGPEYSNEDIESSLRGNGIKYNYYAKDDLCRRVAKLLSQGKIVGWFQGRMEWGPRALGNRSILADPRNPEMKNILNKKVKHRESFRPYAPSVLEEKCGEYFEGSYLSPFMLLVHNVKSDKQKVIPAITHVDGTARIQTVSRKTNPLYYELIGEFEKITGIPVILNTSFNVRGEPIVCNPKDAIRIFIKTEMDSLVLGNFLLLKEQ